MNIEQIYTGCLAQGAYYIESDGEVAIIDPLREVTPYIQRAKNDNAKIKYIFETHFHADFVSGHVTLSKETGAPIIYGPTANPTFDAIIAEDGQEFKLGKLTFKVLHTPGHTMESTTYLLRDENGKDHASARYIFTKLAKITRYIFNIDDDEILEYITDPELIHEKYENILDIVMMVNIILIGDE
mgnify:CR=1 FL=1